MVEALGKMKVVSSNLPLRRQFSASHILEGFGYIIDLLSCERGRLPACTAVCGQPTYKITRALNHALPVS